MSPRRLALAFVGVALCLLRTARPEETAKLQVTAYTIWGVDSPPSDVKQSKLPAGLEKLEAQLKKTAKKKYLAVEGSPSQGPLEPGKAHAVKLPDGTKVEWKLDPEAKKHVVRQILTPPQKDAKPSEVVLKRIGDKDGLRINVISRGEKVLLLVVKFTSEKK